MIKTTCILRVTATLCIVGCKSGAGRHVAQGAVRGAAHGALSSAYQVRETNKAVD